jgi:hypothetical protein
VKYKNLFIIWSAITSFVCSLALFLLIPQIRIYQQNVDNLSAQIDTLHQTIQTLENRQLEKYYRIYDFVLCQNPKIDTVYAGRLSQVVCDYTNKFPSIAPTTLVSLMWHESSFDTLATSPKGAVGIMQLMPKTVAWLKMYFNLDKDYVLMSLDDNTFLGCLYLNYLISHYGQFNALSVYNSGYLASQSRHGNFYAVNIQQTTLSGIVNRE